MTDEKVINKHIFKANFGLEKESIRVDEEGRPARTPHPFPGISKISRDFSENQVEFITGVSKSPDGALYELERLHRRAAGILKDLPTGPEYIWPFSNPPAVEGDEDNPVARFGGDSEWKTEYRKYLSGKYGNKLMLYSGIHVNFSFDEEYLDQRFDDYLAAAETQEPEDFISDRTSYINRLYLDLAIWSTKYSWLIIYLLGASPVFHSSFFKDSEEETETRQGDTVTSRYASPRTGHEGYWNDFDPVLDYSDLKAYADSIIRYVEEGTLLYPAELYYPVRIKPRGNYNLESLVQYGVDHIELRIVDDNPYAPAGMLRHDICFIHLLLIYLLAKGRGRFPEEEQLKALSDMKKAALLDDSTLLSNGKSIRENAEEVLSHMKTFFSGEKMEFARCANCGWVIEQQLEKTKGKGARYAERVVADFGQDYQNKGLELAKRNSEELLQQDG